MHALSINSIAQKVANNGVVAMRGEKCITFTVQDFTTVKFQGSFDNGATYSDIGGSLVTAVTEGTDIADVSFTSPRCDHIKVVATTASTIHCVARQTGLRNVPADSLNRTFVKTIDDPTAGTA